MRKLIIAALLLLRSCECAPAAVRLDCDPVSTATSYRVHLGQQSGRYTNTITSPVPSITLSNLAPGQWFAVITAHNAAEACPFWETSDKSDDATEITFTINSVEMVELVLARSTNANSPRSTWTPVVTNRVPKLQAMEFYALRIAPVGGVATSPSPTNISVVQSLLDQSGTRLARSSNMPAPPSPIKGRGR